MSDNLTKVQRSKTMSLIRSRWTNQEKLVHNLLKGHKIKHKMHPKLNGNPDIFIPISNTVIFLHGCFWHKCKKCYIKPVTNKEYWHSKLERNAHRDKQSIKILKAKGYRVLVFWEHQIKRNFEDVIIKILQRSANPGLNS